MSCLQPSPLSLRRWFSSSDPFAYFHPIVVVASVHLFGHMSCYWAVRVYVFQDYNVGLHIFYSLFLQWCQYCLDLYRVKFLLVIHEPTQSGMFNVFAVLLFKLVYGTNALHIIVNTRYIKHQRRYILQLDTITSEPCHSSYSNLYE